MDKDNYEPYGEEWEKEMMKFPKKALIQFLRKPKEQIKPKVKDKDKLVKERGLADRIEDAIQEYWKDENTDKAIGSYLVNKGLVFKSSVEVDKWISCEDRLPEKYLTVLVEGGCAYWNGVSWLTLMTHPKAEIQWEVTHWQPLPSITDIIK